MAFGSDLVMRLLIQAQDLTGSAVKSARDGIQSIATTAEKVYTAVKQFLTFQVSVGGIQEFTRLADTYQNLQSRLRLATNSQQEFSTAQERTFEIAQQTRSNLESIANLYARTAKSIAELGGSQRDALELSQLIAESFKISGASAAESSAGIQQLSQALASGVLRGDEFNSVMESSPRLAQALADGLSVPVGKLRAMAEAGELTADRVARALLSQKDRIANEFASMPVTVSDAVTQAENELLKFAGELNANLGITGKLVAAIQSLTLHIGDIAAIAAVAGLALAKHLTVGLLNFGAAQIEAIRSGKALQAQLLAERAARLETLKTAELEAAISAKTSAALAAEAAARMAVARAAYTQASGVKSAAALAEVNRALVDYQAKAGPARDAQNRLITAQQAYADELDKAPVKIGLVTRAINLLGNAFNLLQAGLIGFEIGKFLSQFEVVRLAGSWIAEFSTVAGTGLERIKKQLAGEEVGSFADRMREILKIHEEFKAVRAGLTDDALAQQAASEQTLQNQQQATIKAQQQATAGKEAAKAAKTIADEFAKLSQAGIDGDFSVQINAVQNQLISNPQSAADLVKPVQEFVGEALRLNTQLSDEKKRQAKDVAETEKRSAQEALQAQIDGVRTLLDEKRRAAQQASDAQQAAEQKAASARQAAADISATGADKIRALQRRDLSPEAQQIDIAKQANEKLAQSYYLLEQARATAQEGDTAQAERLAAESQKAADSASSLGESLNDTKQAVNVVSQATQLAAGAQQTVAQANDQAAAQAKANLTQLNADITALEQKLAALEGQQKTIAIQAQTDEAKTRLDEIKAQLDELQDKTITVTVNRQDTGAATSSVPAQAAPPHIPGFAAGTILPGYGGGDRRVALLEDGEAILPKERVRAIGYDNVRRLIAGQLPGFSTGGIVQRVAASLPQASALTPARSAATSGQPVNLYLPGGQSFTLNGQPDVVKALTKAIGREALKHGRAV